MQILDARRVCQEIPSDELFYRAMDFAKSIGSHLSELVLCGRKDTGCSCPVSLQSANCDHFGDVHFYPFIYLSSSLPLTQRCLDVNEEKLR